MEIKFDPPIKAKDFFRSDVKPDDVVGVALEDIKKGEYGLMEIDMTLVNPAIFFSAM